MAAQIQTIIKLDIYENEDLEVLKRTATGATRSLSFGTVRKLMNLFTIDAAKDDSAEIMATVAASWESVQSILGRMFPDITPEEWDCVALEDVVAVVLQVVKAVGKQVVSIPTSGTEKN